MVTVTADERELLRDLLSVCRCNGHHIPELDPDLGETCIKCGPQRCPGGGPGSSRELFERFHAVPRPVTAAPRALRPTA